MAKDVDGYIVGNEQLFVRTVDGVSELRVGDGTKTVSELDPIKINMPPSDGELYGAQDGQWVPIVTTGAVVTGDE